MYRSQKKQPDRRNYTRLWCGAHPPLPPTQRVLVKWSPIDATKMYQSKKQFLHLRLRSFLVGDPPNKNHICAFLFVCTFRTRPGTFETRQVVQSKKDLFKDRNKKNANPIKVSSSSVSPSNKKEANTTKTTHKQERRLTIKVPVSLLAIY